MKELIAKYLKSVSEKFSHKETSEMGYRTDFEILLTDIFKTIKVKRIDNDPNANEGNRPDFILYKEVPILYIETKNIGTSLDKVEKSEQMARYFGYDNLVLTDYLEFRFYRNGLPYEKPIKIADYDIKERTIEPLPVNYEHLAKTLLDFAQSHKEPIRSGEHLARIMGGKAQRIRENVRYFLANDSEKNAEILRVYEAIKKLLVHDLTPESFADMYAQTLVYGLFVARYYDDTPETFSREEAREHMPASNPFLRHFFDHIAGPNFEPRLKSIVDELCVVFQHSNIKELIEKYMDGEDPVIHFYEDFLKEYDPDLRKRMGAYYTPLPVVRFIVRSVDYLLEKEFGLAGGLADTTKLSNGKHRVQILDPAAGTGTFISAAIRSIYERLKKQGQEGRWPAYVHNDLLPRLHGFELMMAPYTIAHLKLSMAFKQTGFWKFHRRLGIYLTNSLEKSDHRQTELAFGFAESIAEEAREADKVKSETPIMVVIGNPPYSVSSSNKGEWIQDLIKVYKQGLGEKKINLDDDYIKFLRYAEHFIEKNKSGIVAMITNNSYIDGITHRQMRKHLLETFDDIYILDLHGNSKKKEKSPDGGKDENVFDIQQGVAVSIFVRRTGEKTGLGAVHHAELYGRREDKFKALNESDLRSIKRKKLDYSEPYYFFVPKDFRSVGEYEKGFKIDELFGVGSSGIESAKDDFIIKYSGKEALKLKDFIEVYSVKEIADKYNLGSEKSAQVKNDSVNIIGSDTRLLYRPFDMRYTLYSPNSQGVWWRPRYEIMKHMFKENIGLIAKRGLDESRSAVCFISKCIIDRRSWSRPGMLGAEQLFPLYFYNEDGSKISNLKKEIVDNIEKAVGGMTPEDIFDYIYAVLHSPSYRETYKEFLKIDFPRVPYPKDAETFKALVELGTELRLLHLLESPKVNKYITIYPVAGSNVVEKVSYKDGKVYINKEQYFGKVPEVAWNFYIGGYQPAQKWLKDRKGRALTNADIEHYQKIIVALTETDRIMGEIDKINI